MNQDRAKHLLPIVEHLANGGSKDDVQQQYMDKGWDDWDGIFESETYVYRLKPQSEEMFVNEYPNGLAHGLYKTEIIAIELANPDCIATRRVTVHPEDES